MHGRLFVTLTALLLLAGLPSAQAPASFKARLGVTPVDANNQPLVTGSGSVTAVLNGATLSVSGTYRGLQSPATSARIHVGPRGIRGPAILDLVVAKATAGSITGDVMLSPAQVDHLRRGRLYVQVNSERAADGNLWGWLLP